MFLCELYLVLIYYYSVGLLAKRACEPPCLNWDSLINSSDRKKRPEIHWSFFVPTSAVKLARLSHCQMLSPLPMIYMYI